jgi:hypothetical protein
MGQLFWESEWEAQAGRPIGRVARPAQAVTKFFGTPLPFPQIDWHVLQEHWRLLLVTPPRL